MNIIRLIVGAYQSNCYVLVKESDALIVDPGSDYEVINEVVKEYKIKGILVTHYHFDHIGALSHFMEYPIFDYKKLGDNSISNFEFETIKTDGHTNDSVSFKFDDVIFTGDFLFKGTIGRTDFENSNHENMLKSIEMFKKFNNDFTIYPGHGDKTTLFREKQNNYFFK